MSLIAREVFVILGGRDDRHQLIATLGGLPDALEGHAIRLGVELAEELGELRVVRQDVVGADLVAEELLRRGDPAVRPAARCGGGRERDGHEDESERIALACMVESSKNR